MIYISGPITGTDDYMERFDAAERKLTENGFIVLNPARVNAAMPVLSDASNINILIALLAQCDKIYMLDGWQNGKGSRLERAYAEAMGKEIMYQTPQTKEKKYHWRLRENLPDRLYLNFNKSEEEIILASKCEVLCYITKFTESEYKKLAKRYHLSEDMFVKEEIE